MLTMCTDLQFCRDLLVFLFHWYCFFYLSSW